MSDEAVSLTSVNQVNRAASEAAPTEFGPETSLVLAGDLDQGVEGGRAVVEEDPAGGV